MSKILVAGPWTGEFGYELFKWQGYIRKVVEEGGYDEVIVSSRPGNELLYRDFCTTYMPVEADINPCEGRFNGNKENQSPHDYFKGIPYLRAIDPGFKITDEPQSFIPYGVLDRSFPYDVVIHARGIAVGDRGNMVPTHADMKESRNWGIDKWTELTHRLTSSGMHVCCIGSPTASWLIPGAADHRGVPLDMLADILVASSIIVGPSSGPLHFATLCGCKQAVWGSPHLEARYKELWNPFGTPVNFMAVDDNWDPDVMDIEALILG